MIFADANGELDVDAPNQKGWADTVAYIETLGTDMAALHELADKGSTEDLRGLLTELESIATVENADVEEVLDALEEAAREAEDILIVSA